jgi:hypothetical protein
MVAGNGRKMMIAGGKNALGMVVLVCLCLFLVAQALLNVWYVPLKKPSPISTSDADYRLARYSYGAAYVLSLLRLPFGILPYAVKLGGMLLFHASYRVSDYNAAFEICRIAGECLNWYIVSTLFLGLGVHVPVLNLLFHASIIAEAVRLFAEKGQMIFSAGWQILPHQKLARWLEARPGLAVYLHRYIAYFALSDEPRIAYVIETVHGYAQDDAATSCKLDYLSTFRIVPPWCGLRGGQVRDVARGEVFIHQSWTSDPYLLIGMGLRRTPWMFDPRFLRRPFHYRSQSNRLATLFVLSHWRYSPSYALYQWGHEIKVARYDFFYRLSRALGQDIEPYVLADGAYPFDHITSRIRLRFRPDSSPAHVPQWTDEALLQDVRRRVLSGESLTAFDIAVQYTYPLQYVEDVLIHLLPTTQLSTEGD